MKTSPRLACRFSEAWNTFHTGSGQPTRLAGWHARHCPACRASLSGPDVLAATLQRDAVQLRQPAPPHLEDRIMRAIRTEPRAAAEAAHSGRSPRWLLAVPVAGAALAVVLLFTPRDPSELPPAVSGPEPVASAAESAAPDWNAVREPVIAALQEDPLQQEVDSVVADAKGALRFLALNFLPEPTGAGRRVPRSVDG